ncbi:hypothetical protein [Methylocella silvestris]|nr:hypothetical protein [Methylocella silvestris]
MTFQAVGADSVERMKVAVEDRMRISIGCDEFRRVNVGASSGN